MFLINFFILFFVKYCFTHPAPSLVTCHGLQLKTGYNYLYKTTLFLNNNDHLGKEPVGFKFSSYVSICNIWQNQNNYILLINLTKDRKFTTLKDETTSDHETAKTFKNDFYPLYAHIYEDDSIQKVINFYVHTKDSITDLNIKRAIVRRLRTKPSDFPNVDWIVNGQNIIEKYDSTKNLEHFESMFRPDKSNKYEVEIKLNKDHSYVSTLNGWQNITFGSKLYKEAHSSYYSTFHLDLQGNEKCHDNFNFNSNMNLDQVLKKLEDELRKTSGIELNREKEPCHNCKQLNNLVLESKESLNEDKAATLDSSLVFLTLVERIRSSGPGAGKKEILDVLNQIAKVNSVNYKSKNNKDFPEILCSLLDHCAAARTEPALDAALEHLDLPTNQNLDIAERFLVTSSVSFMTLANTNAANSGLLDSSNVNSAYVDRKNLDTSHIYFTEKLLQLLKNHNWSSVKLKWATQLAIGNLIKSHNIMLENEFKNNYKTLKELSINLEQSNLDSPQSKEYDFISQVDDLNERNLIFILKDDLNEKVVNYLINQYTECKNTDCREVALVSLGNTGNLVLVLNVLEKAAVQSKLRREQVGSLKALKECLEFNEKYNPVLKLINSTDKNNEMASKLNYKKSGLHYVIYEKIKNLLATIVYDQSSVTTSRIIASELIAKYFSKDYQLINTLIQDLRNFNNFELTTLMWTKMQHVYQQKQKVSSKKIDEDLSSNLQCNKENQLKHINNWVHAPNILNGSSTLFLRPLGSSSTMNATYGISMELLSAGKVLRETTFDVGLEGLRAAEQSVLGVSIFARGLASFSNDDVSSQDDNEETTAGMSLKILDSQLRPYTFFTGKSELMSHVWSGTGSTPTPIFRGNFLVIDHEQAIGLLNGFVLEEKIYGVLSLDVMGQVTVSLWNRNSHSVVTANSALLIRGSHHIRSSQADEAFIEQRFAFGGDGRIEFITDTDFYNTPIKMCLQITQPEFNIRHNTRKYEQINAAEINRRIHRRSYKIPAKSYPLHKDNNIMCAAMNLEN